MREEFIFEIDSPRKEFKRHIDLSYNERIIFSAPFGAGKTHFLKEFFKDNSDYATIHIYPVNYSVANNEDIFELIKHDILFQLLGKNLEFEKIEFGKFDYLPLFLEENKNVLLNVFEPFLEAIPLIGKNLVALNKTKENFICLYKKFENQLNNLQIDDKSSLIEYLKTFTQTTGNIYEEDFFTQVICQLINQLKQIDENGKPNVKTVLIIDDLDRIDPEHIFRILNVLSAQMDKDGSDNKFDFDKIILVFDQQNVRNIFKNRYGANVDYTGYIDKFYSHEIFNFSNFYEVKQKLIELLKTIQIKGREFDFSKDKEEVQGLLYVFRRLIDANVLTIRRLIGVLSSNFQFNGKEIVLFKGINEEKTKKQFLILFVAEFLLFVFEEWSVLLNAIEKSVDKKRIEKMDEFYGIRLLLGEALLILDIKQNNLKVQGFHSQNHEPYRFRHGKTGLEYEYVLDKDPRTRIYYSNLVSRINDKNISRPRLMPLLLDTLIKIKNDNLLNR